MEVNTSPTKMDLTPFYEDEWATLYHGDAYEVLTTKGVRPEGMAVTITDPPYNVGKDYGEGHDDALPWEDFATWLRLNLRLCWGDLVFFPGTRHFLDAKDVLPEGMRPHRVLGWHKKEYAGDLWNGGPAMCWEPIVWATKEEKPHFNKTFGWRGRDFLVVPATHGDVFKGPGRHPCPKPLAVMDWLVTLFTPEGGTVLDPFAGTGTTLYAARAHGIRSIGIERNEAYCELAAERLSQQRLNVEVAA